MADKVSAIPEGFHSITPALTCKGAAKAIDFYKQAFGAKEISRMEMGGMIAHAELEIGNSKIFISDEFPGMSAGPDSNAKTPSSYLFIYTEDVDRVYGNAVAAGCTATMPLQDQFWGDRYGKVSDPFGHHWGLAQHVEDVSPEEMERRAMEWQANMAKSAGGHN
jgi:PhnB protein